MTNARHPVLAILLTAAFAGAGATLAMLASVVLARARAPAPVPTLPVAIGTAVLWSFAGWRWLAGAWPGWWLPVPLALATFAVPLAAADLRHRRLPNALTLPAYPALATALVTAAAAGPGPPLAIRAAAAAVLFGGAHMLVHALSRRSLGAGDVKLAGVLGAVAGAVHWMALVLAAALASVVTVVLALVRHWRRGVPHGPGMLAATWLVAVFPGTGMGT
ncbi:prepilin peptidase [Amycolatopsis sacchari]|uniref:prepilin peptidase n=1 Tax=Amycolatopsis sacchari TaxID=115433 RepID=UPI003EC05930